MYNNSTLGRAPPIATTMIASTASVAIPKFVQLCGRFVSELRNRRTLATYCSSVALVQKSAFRTRRENDADF